jgi:hypothetical protein
MTVYLLRHKPSGLFFKNAKHSYRRDKFNLCEAGKVYFTKPLFSWISGSGFRDRAGREYGRFVEADWEIIERELG